jgi:hypothetical protein
VITGFNTDIEYEGVVYHVQTEDKGLESPLILSLVYAGGAILASKRSRYEDLIESGFDEEALAQRLKRQHRLICAAINAGRIEDLKRMGGERGDEKAETASAPPQPLEIVEEASDEAAAISEPAPPLEIVDNATYYASLRETPEIAAVQGSAPDLEIVTNASDYASVLETPQAVQTPDVEVPEAELEPEVATEASPYTVHDSRRQSPLGEPALPDGLKITILDEQEFWAGGSFHIRIKVVDRTNQRELPVIGAMLSVKVLGTAFRPQLYSVKTEGDGVAVVSAQIPRFTSGRAAILIRAAAEDGRSTETRRVILAAK